MPSSRTSSTEPPTRGELTSTVWMMIHESKRSQGGPKVDPATHNPASDSVGIDPMAQIAQLVA